MDQLRDQDAFWQIDGVHHQYKILESADGKKWKLLVDKSRNMTDVPHDYIELGAPVRTRYLRLVNLHMPTGKFAISGLRAFGYGQGEKPEAVKEFIVLRTAKDKRSAWLRWSPSDNAYAYKINMGIANKSIIVLGLLLNEYHQNNGQKNILI
jgi:hypothetical protein